MGFGVFTTCTSCKHCSPNKHPLKTTGDGSFTDTRPDYEKVWCAYRKEYVRPGDAQSWCYEEGSSGSSGCFLTSACVSFKGLSDDCRELTALRAFRDGYLKSTEEGCALVEEYYRIAPEIVKAIDASQKRAEIYEYIYQQVLHCITLIESDNYAAAVDAYRTMVESAKAQAQA